MPDFPKFWQRRRALNILLLPASFLFAAAADIRRRWLVRLQKRASLPPVIIVGNITAGGGGKTPIVIEIAQQLAARGWTPGIISRGYGRRRRDTRLVDSGSDWQDCGDEPLLMHRRTGLPVCVGGRLAAARRLADAGCDVIISDDGLQSYALPRAVEIGVVNAAYRFGNGWRLPAGPLREGIARLQQCTLCLLVGGADEAGMVGVSKESAGLYALAAPQQPLAADFFSGKTITALAGIAHPTDFFRTVEQQGIRIDKKIPLADHTAGDLGSIDSDAILMTEKDAVKYPAADRRLYALALRCPLPPAVVQQVEEKLAAAAKSPAPPAPQQPTR